MKLPCRGRPTAPMENTLKATSTWEQGGRSFGDLTCGRNLDLKRFDIAYLARIRISAMRNTSITLGMQRLFCSILEKATNCTYGIFAETFSFPYPSFLIFFILYGQALDCDHT